MNEMSDEERAAFFRDVDAACRKAVWAAVATAEAGAPRVRLVHPTWEGEALWFATSGRPGPVWLVVQSVRLFYCCTRPPSCSPRS